MRTLLHVSDLHFGRDDPKLAEGLLCAIRKVSPDVVAVSGDLTQRGKQAQFEAAADFLGKLALPTVVVPGNHDGAYFNPIRRLFFPLHRFQEVISDDLYPVYRGPSLHVVGVNSVRPFSPDLRAFWKNGSLCDKQLQRINDLMADAPAGACRVLVVHHPLANPHDQTTRDCIRRRERIVDLLSQCGVELVLSGHLHHAYVRLAPARPGQKAPLCAVAGTAISTRRRLEANSFNVIRISTEQIEVTPHAWNGSNFAPGQTICFDRASLPASEA